MSEAFPEVRTESLSLARRDGTPQRGFLLRVVSGADAGKALVVDGSQARPLHVGTSRSADLVLRDPAVSRRHLTLDLGPGGLRVRDAGSTNGLRLGSHRVLDAFLEGGETLRLGQTTLQVEALGTPARMVVAASAGVGRIVGASAAMRRIYPVLGDLARSKAPLLLEGEAGVGKELFAETIHERGGPERPFVVFQAYGKDDARAEAELFGEGGAWAEATGGTLLVDEPCDLSPALQLRLLRALEVKSPLRLMATSRRSVDGEVEHGRLREDLALELSTSRLEIPPLRDRDGDVALLAAHFYRSLDDERTLPALTVRRFEAYGWPGNVRELRAAVRRFHATGADALEPRETFAETGHQEDPTTLYRRVLASDLALPQARAVITDDFDRRYVERVLARHAGNVTRAAASSGLARRYFQILKSKRGL